MIPNYPLFALEVLLAVLSVGSTLDFSEVVRENVKLYGYNFTKVLNLCPLRIVGGISAEIEDIPYQASIRDKIWGGLYFSSFCGGAIVTPTSVITAAHCFENRRSRKRIDNMMVVAGTTRTVSSYFHMTAYEEYSKIKYYYQHPNYNLRNVLNDLGLVTLSKPFTLSKKVMPIRIHTADLNLKIPTTTMCVASGFGLVENDQHSRMLRMVCIPVISRTSCANLFHPDLIHDSTLCAGSPQKDSCLGDSGGPLLCGGVLAGIVSWGGKCGEKGGVYTRIASYATGENIPLIDAVVYSSSHCLLWSRLIFYMCLLSIYFCLR